MKFRQLIAKYASGRVLTDELPTVALSGLNEGLDTPSLRILAGLEENENSFVVQQYFKSALAELGLTIPDRRRAVLEYALAIADEIFEAKTELIKGTSEIVHSALDGYDFFSENKKFVYDSIGFERVYGLSVEYNELMEADTQWQGSKTNLDLMSETKNQLLVELRNWSNYMKTNFES